MPAVSISATFSPEVMKAYRKNESTMNLSLKNLDASKTYWCECEISVKPPLSLAHDKELGAGKTRIGIIKPSESREKQIKVFTSQNSFPDEYTIGITAFVYDEDAAIAERVEQKGTIRCEG